MYSLYHALDFNAEDARGERVADDTMRADAEDAQPFADDKPLNRWHQIAAQVRNPKRAPMWRPFAFVRAQPARYGVRTEQGDQTDSRARRGRVCAYGSAGLS